MSDISCSKRIAAVALAVASLSASSAFCPQNSIRATSVSFRSQDSLVSRNALFGLFETDTATTRPASGNSKNLIEKTKYFIDNQTGFYSEADPDIFAQDFVFRGPQVGPLNKKDYLETMKTFNLPKSFPDISANPWGFSLDPSNPNRVWFMVRNTATFDGDAFWPELLNIPSNGAKVEGPPETFSVLYDDQQKIKYLSVGYVADRFDGNTEGLGAALGIFNAIGLPLPRSGPILQAVQWLGSETLNTGVKSYSTDIPEWFLKEKGSDKGDKGYA